MRALERVTRQLLTRPLMGGQVTIDACRRRGHADVLIVGLSLLCKCVWTGFRDPSSLRHQESCDTSLFWEVTLSCAGKKATGAQLLEHTRIMVEVPSLDVRCIQVGLVWEPHKISNKYQQ